jgi:hypothetical protein
MVNFMMIGQEDVYVWVILEEIIVVFVYNVHLGLLVRIKDVFVHQIKDIIHKLINVMLTVQEIKFGMVTDVPAHLIKSSSMVTAVNAQQIQIQIMLKQPVNVQEMEKHMTPIQTDVFQQL